MNNAKHLLLWALFGIAAYSAFNGAFGFIQNAGELLMIYLVPKKEAIIGYSIVSSFLYPAVFALVLLPIVKKRTTRDLQFPTVWFIVLLVMWPLLHALNVGLGVVQVPLISRTFGIEEVAAFYQSKIYTNLVATFIPVLTVIVCAIIYLAKGDHNTSSSNERLLDR